MSGVRLGLPQITSPLGCQAGNEQKTLHSVARATRQQAYIVVFPGHQPGDLFFKPNPMAASLACLEGCSTRAARRDWRVPTANRCRNA